MLATVNGDAMDEKIAPLSVGFNSNKSRTPPAAAVNTAATDEEEEQPLPKSNLLGLFDMCGDDGKSASKKKDSPVVLDGISSTTTPADTTKQEPKHPNLVLSTNAEKLEKIKCDNCPTNTFSPTGIDELQVVEPSTPAVVLAEASPNAEEEQDDQEAAIVASALVKAAMSRSISSTAPPSDLTVASTTLKDFSLHPLLTLDLFQPCINRLAFYGIIHDINKEATEMAKEDGSFPIAASGLDSTVALIDEEEWLLTAVASRTEEETQRTLQDQLSQSCVSGVYRLGGSDNFAYACGEKDSKEPPVVNEYGDNPNPVVAMNSGSRTQLWKPSRSWWEARSSKNPWIDPKNHVKRWRYLWPLIHYHKFLAKCVKKLKRHGFSDFLDPNASPIVSFLRCEICAVSNHLAACSKFNSEQWLEALEHFSGWNNISSEAHEVIRALVEHQLKERTCQPDARHFSSPLLRKVMESSTADLSEHLLGKKDDASQMPETARTKGRKSYTGNCSTSTPADSALWQGYRIPYNQPLYGYYNPQMYPNPTQQQMMGAPRYPNSNRRGSGAPHRSRVPKGSNLGGYANNNYPRYGMEQQYSMGYFGNAIGQQFHYPQDFGMHPTEYSGFSQVSAHGSTGQQYDELSTVATNDDDSSFRRSDFTTSPVRTNMVESSPIAPFRSPQSHNPQATSTTQFIRSPPTSVPPSPFWGNFANQVVDYVCDSPFGPRSATTHQHQPHHRMTPCHHLGGPASSQEEGNILVYNNFYQLSGIVTQPSPASQFASSTSTAFFSGSSNNYAQPAVDNKRSSSDSLALTNNS